MRCVFFLSKLQTCIQINKYTKVKKKHFIFNIQNNNKNRKHIKIKNKKDKSFLKELKHEPNIVKITHRCIRQRVQTSNLYKRRVLTSVLFWAKFRQLTDHKKEAQCDLYKGFFLKNFKNIALFLRKIYKIRQI